MQDVYLLLEMVADGEKTQRDKVIYMYSVLLTTGSNIWKGNGGQFDDFAAKPRMGLDVQSDVQSDETLEWQEIQAEIRLKG